MYHALQPYYRNSLCIKSLKQQNSFNPVSNNFSIQHFKGVVSRSEVIILTKKKKSCIYEIPKSVHTSTAVVPPAHLPPTPSTSSAMKTAENTKAEPDDPKPAGEGSIQMESYSD